MAGSG
ncbi:hypothetical protein AVEN_82646-1, partial [Araneus ventricosus]